MHFTRYDVSSIYFAVQWWNSSSNCFILLYFEFVLIRHPYIVNFLFGFVCIFLLCCINWMQISAINSNISNCKRKCNFVYYENIASTNFNDSTVYESVTKVLKIMNFDNTRIVVQVSNVGHGSSVYCKIHKNVKWRYIVIFHDFMYVLTSFKSKIFNMLLFIMIWI